MAKKDKKKFKETTIEDFYDLRVDKIDELVAALKDDGAEPAEEEVDFSMNANMGVNDPKNVKRSGKEKQFDPYRTDFLAKVPVWLKALFVKFWFSGAVCFFIMWGVGLDGFAGVVLSGVVVGVVTDVLVNPLFRFMETDKHEYDAYMLLPFPFKAFWTFFANIVYYLIVVYGVNLIYYLANQLFFIAVEPLLFGLFTFLVDMIFIGIKDGIVALVRHVKKKKKETANV